MTTKALAPTTPLERLKEANAAAMSQRRKKPRPLKRPDDVERYYRAQLRQIVKLMRREVDARIMPLIRANAKEYTEIGTNDAGLQVTHTYKTTYDAFNDDLVRELESLAAEWSSANWEAQYQRLAEIAVNRTVGITSDDFLKKLNSAMGVDMSAILNANNMRGYTRLAVKQNVELIKSIPQRFFARIETDILQAVMDGKRPSFIAQQLQEATGVSQRQAKFIARDQVAKINSQVVERRQSQAGIKHYRVSTSNDERVTGNPAGLYPNAKISCYGIARKDIGFGPGVYTWAKGASWAGETGLHPGRHHPGCRCTATPVFEWELPGN